MSALVWTLCADKAEARALAEVLVGEGLAACANLVGSVESVFVWQGAVETTEECGVLFKTHSKMLAKLVARIEQLHRYECPAILGWHCGESGVATGQWLARLAEPD